MLDRFTDYFYPAITNFNERVYRKSAYVLNDVCIYEVGDKLVLTGILIETRDVVNQTKYDKENKEVHDDGKKMEIQPVSYFGIFLDNHKMYYIKNQSESPSVEKFKSTITYALREYRKMKNRELRVGKSNDDIWQAADLNINAIPSKIADDYKSFFILTSRKICQLITPQLRYLYLLQTCFCIQNEAHRIAVSSVQ